MELLSSEWDAERASTRQVADGPLATIPEKWVVLGLGRGFCWDEELMLAFLNHHFEHLLCGLLLVSRVGDIGSTYLLTPRMALEANPIMHRLGWRFALLTLLICFVPYFSTQMAVMILVPFLLISASNTGKIWFVRTYGELEYRELLLTLARRSKLQHALAGVNGSAAFLFLAGLVMLYLSPNPARYWGFWVALGILTYAFIIALWGSIYFVRLFRTANQAVPDIGSKNEASTS